MRANAQYQRRCAAPSGAYYYWAMFRSRATQSAVLDVLIDSPVVSRGYDLDALLARGRREQLTRSVLLLVYSK